jgi:hypothetical protein
MTNSTFVKIDKIYIFANVPVDILTSVTVNPNQALLHIVIVMPGKFSFYSFALLNRFFKLDHKFGYCSLDC